MKLSASIVLDTEKTNIKHNNREMSEKEKVKNDHINYDRSDKNVYLVQENLKDFYEKEFGESLKKYNKKQRRADRKIKNYYEHIKASKKTAVQQELLVQIGDSSVFDKEENREVAVELLKTYFDEFQKRNKNLKIFNAVIHDDEASPHLHINFVPVATGYKRGLEKQVSFNRAIQQQSDKFKDNERPFTDWREQEVLELEKVMSLAGIERNQVGTNLIKDVNEYKKVMYERAKDFEYHKVSEDLKNAQKRNLELSEELESVSVEKDELKAENKRLESENRTLRQKLEYFVENVETLYFTAREFLGKSFSEFKNWFRTDIHEKGFESEFDLIESDLKDEKNKAKFNEFEK